MEGFGALMWVFYLVIFLVIGAIVFGLVYLITMFFILGKQEKADTSYRGRAGILLQVILISLLITSFIMFLLIELTN